jgi:hypothetical protein
MGRKWWGLTAPNYYKTGEYIMLKHRNALTFFVATLLVLILAACSTQPASLPGTGSGQPPEPVVGAQNWLADQLGVPADQVEVVTFSPVEWTDSCLGLGGPAESCLQATTPGYQVTLKVAGQEYEVRTDASAETIRSPQFPG